MRKVVLSLLVSIFLVATTSAQIGVIGTPAPPESDLAELPSEGCEPPPDPSTPASAVAPPLRLNEPLDTSQYQYGVWRNLRPTESQLYGLSMLAPSFSVDCTSPDQMSAGWAVGTFGTILGYCDGVWDHFIAPTLNDLVGVETISPTLALAVGSQGTFLAYQWYDTEKRWEWIRYPVQPQYTAYLRSISIVPSSQPGVSYEGWTVGDNGAMARVTAWPSLVGGITQTFTFQWEVVQPVVPDVVLAAVQMLSPDEGWAVGGWRYSAPHSSVMLHWDGTQWTKDDFGDSALFGLHMLSSTDGWAVGENGIILHYDGTGWSQVSSPTTQILRDVYMLSPNEGWAVGHYGALLHYHNGTWSLLTDLRMDPFDYMAVDFTSGIGWAVGTDNASGIGGVIVRYDDDYENWLAVTSPTVNHLYDVYTLGDNDAWAVGAYDELGGTILHWDGRYWQRIYQADIPIPSANLYTIDMVEADEGWTMGDPLGSPPSSLILRYNGYRWAPTRFQSPINVAVNSVSMLDGDFGWAVGAGDRAVLSYDNANPPYSDQWIGVAACGGALYYLRGVSVVSSTVSPTGDPYDAWAVGQVMKPDGST